MLDQLFSMRDKVCVITGGSRGLGFYMAKAFLAAGAQRVYITSRKADECNAAAEELAEWGEAIALPGDISSMDEIRSLADFQELGWDKVMNLNVKSPFFLTRELLPLLKRGATPEDTASVINIGSIAGICAATDTLSYAPSKAAIHQVTRNLAVLLADDNIRVNAIAPGRFFTRMTEYASEDKAQYESEIAYIPLHRWGEESDISGVALMLAARAGAFITGQIIPVDGGTSLVR